MSRQYQYDTNNESYSNLEGRTKEELIELINFMRDKYEISDPESEKWKELAFNLQNLYAGYNSSECHRDNNMNFIKEYNDEISELLTVMRNECECDVRYWRTLCKNDVNYPDKSEFDLHHLFTLDINSPLSEELLFYTKIYIDNRRRKQE